jgi:hypothetical protein
MKRSLLLFVIVVVGFSPSLSAKKDQKYICQAPETVTVQIPYKTIPFSGKSILSVVDNPNLYLDICPNSITVDDKIFKSKKHVLWISSFDKKNCYYGTDEGVSCVSTHVSE